MLTSILNLFHNKKLGKRILAGTVAMMLIFATLLGDVNIAYAQAGNAIIAAENSNATMEMNTSEDAETSDLSKEFTEVNQDSENLDKADGDVVKTENLENPDPEKTDSENSNAENSDLDNPDEDKLNAENADTKDTDIDEKSAEDSDETEDSEVDITSENMPSINLVQTVEGYEISLECAEGTFAEGTTVEIKALADDEKEEVDRLVEDAITENVDIVKTVSFDITFYDKEGNVVEPADENSVSVKIVPSKQDKEELENMDAKDDEELLCTVFHIEEKEYVEEVACVTVDPVEEILFEAESFSIYEIVWYKNNDGVALVDAGSEGPLQIGEYVKSRHAFIDFNLPLEFTNEGSPADTSLRPLELTFDIYGTDTTIANPEKVLICEVTVPIQNYNNSKKTVSLKESGMSKTDIPVYVQKGTQAQADDGNGNHIIDGFEYTVEFVGMGESIYTIKQNSTAVSITSIPNQAEWSVTGIDTLSAQRQSLTSKKFYVSWVDNRNKAGKRPYSTNDNITDIEGFKNSIKLYRQVEGAGIEAVTDAMLPTTLAEAGPIVGKKGQSISDWQITYNNLPTSTSDGKSIQYYVTVDDSTFKDCYVTVSPSSSVTVGGKNVFLSDTTVKYLYSEPFTATVQWYDAGVGSGGGSGVRLTTGKLAGEFEITDEQGEKVLQDESASSKVIWTKTDGDEWKFKVGPLPMYDELGGEKSYKLVLKDGVIMADDGSHEYSVDYSNGKKTTAHDYCLSDGKIILVINRSLDSFGITKTWADSNDYERRKETVESGVRFLLWRYPKTKQDGTAGTPADGAAVFNPETHAQYSYTLNMSDTDVAESGNVKDSIPITLEDFGINNEHPIDMFDQYGHQYVYYVTEVITKSGYKTVYKNAKDGDFKQYTERVMNGGTMTNVRQEKMKMEGIVKWNVPSVNDYTKTTVTIELQKYEGGSWNTLPTDGDKVYTKTLSGFTVTNPKRSYIFPEVERYDENGKEINYRVVQTTVSYPEQNRNLSYVDLDPLSPSNKEFISEAFAINEKAYQAKVAPTPDKVDSYTIENRLAGAMELVLTKNWVDSGDQGFGKDGCTSYQNITIKVYQHGASTDYSKPYMTITTTGTKSNFAGFGVDTDSIIPEGTEKIVPFTIEYREDLGKSSETGVIQVTTNSEGRATKWEFKKKIDDTFSNITLPAFNESGNAYSYTIEENNVLGAYTTYKYVRNGNELNADVTNTYATGGGDTRTIIFQKEWIDGTDIPQEKPVRIAIVRIQEDGNFYTDAETGKIDLKDNFGEKHIITLTENNNWYNQLGIKVGEIRTIDGVEKQRFDSKGEGVDKRYLYTAIELDMALYNTIDFSREVKYDNKSSVASALENDIEKTATCNKFDGTIDAYLDASHEENHLPGYDVTIKAASDTASVVDATKYVVVNKRKGIVNVEFDKTWHDGSNSEQTRNGTYKVYLYQNGKKVVSTEPADASEVKIENITISIDDVIASSAEKAYSDIVGGDTLKFRFENLPQYDADGNLYQYTVKEFLIKDYKELEIALTDTKDSTKTGYVVTDHSEETHFTIKNSDKTILERNDMYKYTNTITGEKTGGAKFYVLWHDQTSYDKGIRPDVNYVLYYKAKGSDEEPQVYNGEYKAEWHPMYDEGLVNDPSKASRYYQYINFTKLPLANEEGVPYEYYAVPFLNNPGEHYDESYYVSNKDVIVAKDTQGNNITTTAGRHHYDMKADATPLPAGSKMLPEDGVVEYIIDEFIHVEGNKLWKLDDNGEVDTSKLPNAQIYLWRKNDHDKQYSEIPEENTKDGASWDTTTLNDDKTGYAFKDSNGVYKEHPKYDKYGLLYNYSITEKMFICPQDSDQKYSIPNYVMTYQPMTNGITNIYNPEAAHNQRKFTVTKSWEGLPATLDKKPVAEFGLYRVEIPLQERYYTSVESGEEKILNANPTKAAYEYAIDQFKKFKNRQTSSIQDLGKKSITYGAIDSSVVWNDMPIFSPSGLVYLYFTEELTQHGLESFEYDVITEGAGTRPAVQAIGTAAGRENVLISYDKVKAVLFSNYELDPSKERDYSNGSVNVNWQEAGYKNTLKNDTFGKIVGFKTWNDSIFTNEVRPKIGADGQCPEVTLTLKRSAVTQNGYGNQITTETISADKYDVIWYQESDSNKWKFELTPKDETGEFKLYATNGKPYTYTVTESVSGTTLANYKIANKTVTGSVGNVSGTGATKVMTLGSLKNELKGQIKVFKKWDDALNEYNLRSGYVKVCLQYRLVPAANPVGAYNELNPPEISKWKNYESREYVLAYDNHWAQTVSKLPVKAMIQGAAGIEEYRYEYRLLETEFNDVDSIQKPIVIDTDGNATTSGGLAVPNGGFCSDSSSADDRKALYGNSISSELNYKNKYYEIEIGNYHVNNSAIASLSTNISNVSSMELRVDNRLSKKTSLKIEKKWSGINVGDEIVTPEDTYDVLPRIILFKLEYKKLEEDDTQWQPLMEAGTSEQVTIEVEKKDGSYVRTVDNLPERSSDGKVLVYRAIEVAPNLTQMDNLGRFEFTDGMPTYTYDPAVIDGDRTICHTTITNTLITRDITIKKKWNAEEELREEVTVELWSDNFTKNGDPLALVKNTTKTLTAENGWEVNYKNLPKYNTQHEKIHYYVKEAKVGGSGFDANKYAIYFFGQTSETDYSEVTERYNSAVNIAPVSETVYKMYIVNTPKTSLRVTKKWEDEENRQGSRDKVEVTLSDDGGFVDPISSEAKKTLNTQNNNFVTWNYLPIYKSPDIEFVKSSKAHTDKVNYTIKEADTLQTSKKYKIPEYSFGGNTAISSSGYQVTLSSSNNNATITNIYNPPKIRFTATKKWNDEGNRHFSRPIQKGIYVTLYYSTDNKTWKKVEPLSTEYAGKNYPTGSKVYTLSSVTQHIADNGTDTWGTPVWEGLPTKVSNKAIYYKAFETDATGNNRVVTSGYSATYIPDSVAVSTEATGQTVSQEIENTLKRTRLLVSKEWKDTYDVTDRPSAVTFVVEYRCGASDSWKVYKKTDGTVLKVELTGTDHKTGTTHIWEKKVDDLPSTNSEGTKYEYRVKEISVTYGANEVPTYGVTADSVSGSVFIQDGTSWKSESTVGAYKDTVVTAPSSASDYSYKATAVNTPILGKLTVTKKWDDESNRDNIRPHEIKLQLYRKQDQATYVKYGEAVVVGPGRAGTTVSTDQNEWTYTFDKLPVYNNDAYEHTDENKSIYYVKEVDPEHGYEVTYKPESGSSTESFDRADNILMHNSGTDTYSTSEVITNKHEPVRIKIKAHKEWIEGAQDQFRPTSIKLKLQYHMVGETDNWKDVSVVASKSDFDESGTKVETTSSLERILTSNITDDSANKWEKDETGAFVIWENLPAYVNNGTKVEYRLLEYDDTPDGKKISDHYRVVYNHCEYEDEYGKEYSLKVQNILEGMGGILTVDKTWNPDNKDDIAKDDKVIEKIQCHLEQKSKISVGGWAKPDWGDFTLSHEDNWQHTFVHELSTVAVYRVVEDAIIYTDGTTHETVSGSGDRIGSFVWSVSPEIIEAEGENAQMHVTITNEIPDNSITVSKIWADENNRDGKRTHSIKVRLYRDDKQVGEDVILFPLDDKVDSPWEEYTWHNLPIYKNGTLVKSEYKVVEVVENDEFREAYEISYKVDSGADKSACDKITFEDTMPKAVNVSITNKHETHKETIKANKIWKDENNKYETRPKKLFGDYHTYLMLLYKLENNANWEPVNYYSDYDDFEKKGYQYPDHHIYTTSPVIQEVTGNVDESWTNAAIWENVSTRGVDGVLSDSNTDQSVSFKVIEVDGLDYVLTDTTNPKSVAPAGYQAVVEPEILSPEAAGDVIYTNITNTLMTTSLEVEKTWDDSEDKYKTRPEKIRVEVERKKQDGIGIFNNWESVKQLDREDTIIELSGIGDWKGVINNLPLYDQDGKKYLYRAVETALIYADGKEGAFKVKEESTDGFKLEAESGNYVATMENTSEGIALDPYQPKFKLSLTNKLIDSEDDTTSLTVIKKWNDEYNRDRLRTESVTVNLLRDGIVVDTQTLTGTTDPVWEYTWEKLPLYQNGATKGLFGLSKKSVYTVTEKPIAGYEIKITNTADRQITITNTHIPIEESEGSHHKKPEPGDPILVNPEPEDTTPVNPDLEKSEPEYEIIEDVDPEELPQAVTDKIYELIDLPDNDERKENVQKLYNDLMKILQKDPAFFDKLDEETADIVRRFLETGVLGRRRTLPKTGGMVGSVVALLFAFTLIGLGISFRLGDKSSKKKYK